MGQHFPMSSPSFDGQGNHCLSFDYKVWASSLGLINMPAPRLEVYMRTSMHVYSGWKLWTSNGTGDGHVQISVWAQGGLTYWISFVGVVGHPDTTSISVANIWLHHRSCSGVFCAQDMCGSRQENYTFSMCKCHASMIEMGS